MGNETGKNRRNRGVFAPLFLIFIGMVFLLEKNGIIDRHLLSQWWPMVPVILGGWLLAKRLSRQSD